MLLDVASGGELHVALAAGVPASACTFHGNNKSVDELRTAIDRRRAPHRRRQLRRARPPRRPARRAAPGVPDVLLRLTPGVHAHTHEYIATGQNDSKFGFNVANDDAARAVERARRSPSVELVGLHCHIGSNVFAAESFARAAEVMAGFAAPLDLPELVLGGGLGVAYVAGEQAPTITEWADVVLDACRGLGVRPTVSVEPGRSIVAAAAVTVYTIGTIKHIPGVRTYVAVDGGMSDNPRPVLYGSGYEAFLPRAVGAERPRRARVVGKHCESGDVLLFGPPAGRRRRRRPAGGAGHRRLRPLDGVQLQQGAPAAGRVRRRRGRPGSSCAARPTTTSSATRCRPVTPPTLTRMPGWTDPAGLVRRITASFTNAEAGAGRTTRASSRRPGRSTTVSASSTRRRDGDPDPGEVVWTWVPYEDDPTLGKDRPVVIIGRHGHDLSGVALTTKRQARVTSRSGPGRGTRRPAELRQGDRLLDIDPDAVRREGAVLNRRRFDAVVEAVDRLHDVPLP